MPWLCGRRRRGDAAEQAPPDPAADARAARAAAVRALERQTAHVWELAGALPEGAESEEPLRSLGAAPGALVAELPLERSRVESFERWRRALSPGAVVEGPGAALCAALLDRDAAAVAARLASARLARRARDSAPWRRGPR